MPELDFRAPAFSSTRRLRAGERIALERNQSNYLGNVLRLTAGDRVLVFNGRDGEWQAAIAGRKRPDALDDRWRRPARRTACPTSPICSRR